jgi:hypothetical protein
MRYHAEFRNPRLADPAISECYALFPMPVHVGTRKWPDSWEHSGRPGVYLIFSAAEELLYIGKDAALGRRLGTYFQYGENRACKIVDEAAWQPDPPMFVFTIALGESFEAPSLEEYLIVKTSPRLNKTWASR